MLLFLAMVDNHSLGSLVISMIVVGVKCKRGGNTGREHLGGNNIRLIAEDRPVAIVLLLRLYNVSIMSL